MSESGLHIGLNHPNSTENGIDALRSLCATDGKSWDGGWGKVPDNIFFSYTSSHTPPLQTWSCWRQGTRFMNLQSNPWLLFP